VGAYVDVVYATNIDESVRYPETDVNS